MILIPGKESIDEIRKTLTKLEFEVMSTSPDWEPNIPKIDKLVSEVDSSLNQLRVDINEEFHKQ